MKNYKVRVENIAEADHVQQLFEYIGYKKGELVNAGFPKFVVAVGNRDGKYYSSGAQFYYSQHNCQELTIDQLRDLVVLHRNDVGDATHTIDTSSCKYFVSSEDKVFLFDDKENSWVEIEYYSCDLNPITKEKIPYLVKTIDKWEEQQLTSDIPESATCLKIPDDAGAAHAWNGSVFFTLLPNVAANTIWRRTPTTMHTHCTTMPTQPEELPFIDDEPKSCDNVNHPSHYTQASIECIEALEAATVNKQGIEAVCVSNIIKYLWRYESKNGLEDVKKAQWYLQKLVDKLEQNNG